MPPYFQRVSRSLSSTPRLARASRSFLSLSALLILAHALIRSRRGRRGRRCPLVRARRRRGGREMARSATPGISSDVFAENRSRAVRGRRGGARLEGRRDVFPRRRHPAHGRLDAGGRPRLALARGRRRATAAARARLDGVRPRRARAHLPRNLPALAAAARRSAPPRRSGGRPPRASRATPRASNGDEMEAGGRP